MCSRSSWYGLPVEFLVVSDVFFQQMTAYEMGISDWSADGGSADLGFVEGPPQNVCGIEESPVDRDQAKLISHRCDHCGKAAPILPLPYDRLRIEAKVGRCRIKTPSMKIGFSWCAGDGDAVLP